MLAPHTEFGQTRIAPVAVYLDGKKIDSSEWDESLWVEAAEDWYALMSPRMKGKRVRVVERSDWLRSKVAA